MIDIEDMRSFVAVIDSGGFGRAAAQLGISKSMVSRRIAKIEDDLRARLISRTTRGISPTDAGLDFKARCERIVADFDEARAVVAEHGGEVVGRLRISAPLSFGARYVAPVLSELARRHPRLEIDASFIDQLVDISGERFDAAIRIGALRDSSLVARRIGPARGVVVASPAYLARKGRPRGPDDLANHEFLLTSGRSGIDLRFRTGKRWVSVRANGRLQTDNSEALVSWAIEGLGILAAPSFLVSDAIEAGKLEPLLVDHPMEDVAIYVVRPPGANPPRKVRVLIDAIVERFGGNPGWDGCVAHRSPDGVGGLIPSSGSSRTTQRSIHP